MSVDAQSLIALSDAFAALVARAAPSLVSIESRRTRSSGFIWRPGLVVAAEDTLPEDGDLEAVLHGGATAPAKIVGRDPTTAIALLRIDAADRPPLALVNQTPSWAALALAVGATGGAPLAALAIVAHASGPWRSMRGGDIAARIELDARLRSAAFGGAAIDMRGDAFGLLVEGPQRRTLVIPTETIARVAPVLRDKGRIARGYLGLGLQPVAVEGGAKGAIVMSVDEGGPGAKAGLRQGDVVIAADGAPAGDVRALIRNLGPDSVGRSIRLAVSRAGAPLDVDLVVGERPA